MKTIVIALLSLLLAVVPAIPGEPKTNDGVCMNSITIPSGKKVKISINPEAFGGTLIGNATFSSSHPHLGLTPIDARSAWAARAALAGPGVPITVTISAEVDFGGTQQTIQEQWSIELVHGAQLLGVGVSSPE